MENERILPVGHVAFTWNKAHNETQIAYIEDELFTAFRGLALRAALAFRRNKQTHIDEIVLTIYHRVNDGIERKLCQIPCNPGQQRTTNGIVRAVREVLKGQKIIAG